MKLSPVEDERILTVLRDQVETGRTGLRYRGVRKLFADFVDSDKDVAEIDWHEDYVSADQAAKCLRVLRCRYAKMIPGLANTGISKKYDRLFLFRKDVKR